MEKQSLITLESLDKTFPMADSLFYALTQVSFRLQEGEFVGLVGPSGSGKTTLLNIIGALDKASRGNCPGIGPGNQPAQCERSRSPEA